MKRSLTPSSLGLAQGKTPMNEEELHNKAKQLYDDTGSVLITHTQLAKLPAYLRTIIEGVAVSLFGQRKQK
jgi:hypothetical protein